MSQELQIPLLTDLIAKGGVTDPEPGADVDYPASENHELQYEADDEDPVVHASETLDRETNRQDHNEDADYHSVQELLIEEEIRLILDKHMDQAYEEIIRLINHRIS